MNLADRGRLGILPMQDHDRDADPALRNVMYAVRVRGLDEENRPIPIPGTAGDVVGAVVFKPDGEDRQSLAAWAFAMPVVGSARDTVEINASSDRTAVRGKREYLLLPARAPVNGKLQPQPGLEPMRFSRGGEPDTVFNLSGDRKLPPGSGGLLAGALDETKQVGLLLDGGPLCAPNEGGEHDNGTPVYDLNSAGEVDEDRFARLQSAWRVKILSGQNPGNGLGAGAPLEFTPTGSLCWQLTGGGPQVPKHAGGGLVIDDTSGESIVPREKAADAPATVTPTRLFMGTGFIGTTQLRPGQAELPKTEVRDPPTTPPEIRPYTLAMVSAQRGGPIDVGGPSCRHKLGTTTDGESINAAHLTTRLLWRTNEGLEGPLQPKGWHEEAIKPPREVWTLQAHIRHDSKAPYTWGLGQGRGSDEGAFVIETDSILGKPTDPRFPPPPHGEPPPGTRLPPPVKPGQELTPGGIVRGGIRNPGGGKQELIAPGGGIPIPWEPWGSPAGSPPPVKPGPRGPANDPFVGVGGSSFLLGGLITPAEIGGWLSGLPRYTSPLANDTKSPKPGTGIAAGPMYVPGLCTVIPEQKKQRVATGTGILSRPEGCQLLPTASHHAGTGEVKLVADPCKRNQRVATSPGLVLLPPCYTVEDLYNAKTLTTTPQFILPPGTQVVEGTPIATGGVKNGFINSTAVGGGSKTTVHHGSGGAVGAGTKQTSAGNFGTINAAGSDVTVLRSDGALVGAEITGTPTTPASGTGGFYTDNSGNPQHIDDAGAITSLGSSPQTLFDKILNCYHASSSVVGFGDSPGVLTSTGAVSVTQSGDSTRSFVAAVLTATGFANYAQILTVPVQIPAGFTAWDSGNAIVLYHRIGWTGVATSGVCRIQMTIEDMAGNVDTVLRDVTYPTDDGSTWQTIALDASVLPTIPFYLQVKASIATAGAAGTADVDIGDVRLNWS